MRGAISASSSSATGGAVGASSSSLQPSLQRRGTIGISAKSREDYSRQGLLLEGRAALCFPAGGGRGGSSWRSPLRSSGHRKDRMRAQAAPSSTAAPPAAVTPTITATKQLLTDFLHQASLPIPGLACGVACNTLVFTLGYGVLRKGLTREGIAHAWLLGAGTFSAFGSGGYLLLCLYFILGTLVTKLKLKQKQQEGIAEARSGQRGPASVWGSGIAAAVCSALTLVTGPELAPVWQAGFVASICSKLSDTVSSEVGKAYGKTTYLVTTFERVPRGTEGAVSAEGTVAGILAAALFASIAVCLNQVTVPTAGLVAAAAVVANTFESYLGASVQGRVAWLSNDLVNMIQISLAAAIAVIGKAYLAVP